MQLYTQRRHLLLHCFEQIHWKFLSFRSVKTSVNKRLLCHLSVPLRERRYKDTKKISKKQIFREIFGAHPQKRVLVVPPRGRLPCYASAMHGRLKRKQRNFLRKERKDNEHGNTRKNTETDEGTVRITRIKRRQMDREPVTLRVRTKISVRSVKSVQTEFSKSIKPKS